IVGLCFFFFFQAEDGIRDLIVTGVQTCALPICPRRTEMLGLRVAIAEHLRASRAVRCVADQILIVPGSQAALRLAAATLLERNRSEERRVGKECRSRWGG